MKWPFVSRAEHERQRDWFRRERVDHIEAQKAFCDRADAQQARALRAEELLDAIRAERIAEREHFARVLDAERSAHERDMVRSEVRYAELMASFLSLRLQGATEPTPAPVVKPVKVDPVLQAIDAKAPDAKTRAQMLRQVAIDRKADLPEAEIVARIHRGNRPAEDVK